MRWDRSSVTRASDDAGMTKAAAPFGRAKPATKTLSFRAKRASSLEKFLGPLKSAAIGMTQIRRSRGLAVFALAGLLAVGARAQGVRYDNIVLGPSGTPVAAAQIAVCTSSAVRTTTPCSPLAQVYSDEALTQPMANPFPADSLGNYGFWAQPGHYVVQIYGTGITTRTMDVFLACDPTNCSMTSASFSTITAGTLNLTGSLTVNGRGVATEPLASDAVQYVSPNGNDSNDGLSWGTAKQTLYAAANYLYSNTNNNSWHGGTIYAATNSACGGPVSGQGFWIYGTGSSPGTGWLQATGPLTIVGVGGYALQNQASSAAIMVCGSASQPALQIQNVSWAQAPVTIQNVDWTGSIGCSIVNSTTITFDNVGCAANSSVAGNGPGLFVGANSFWLFFRHCSFVGNSNSGKTAGSDAAEAVVMNPGGGSSDALTFIDQSVMYNGDLKYYSGSTSWGLTVRGLTAENQTDGHGVVWFGSSVSSAGTAILSDVMAADASPASPGVENDQQGGGGGNIIVSSIFPYVEGPMDVLSQYETGGCGSNLQLACGTIGNLSGRFYEPTDVARRLFAPTVEPYPNLASQLPSAWTVDGGVTLTTGQAAPDGTTNAGTFTNSNSYNAGVYFAGSNLNLASGDYLIYGVWAKSTSAYSVGSYNIFSSSGPQSCTGITTSPVGAPQPKTLGVGEWDWWVEVLKISGSNSSCYAPFHPIVGQLSSNAPAYFAPVLLHLPASVGDSEASVIALDAASYPDSLTPPVEATLRGHPFAFGGSGDNYFATLDHTALTANQTYDFPNQSGTIALVLSGATGSIGGSALGAGACTSGTVSIAGATTSMAVTVSPSADPGTGFTWEGWVSASGTATVRLCNVTAGSLTPTAETYNVRVIQ